MTNKKNPSSPSSPSYSLQTIRQAGLSSDTTYSLAEGKAKDGKWADALNLYNETLRLQREEFGRTDPQVARTLNDIGVTLSHLGEEYYIKALWTFREAFLIQRKVLLKGDKEISITARNMSILLKGIKITDKNTSPKFRQPNYEIS